MTINIKRTYKIIDARVGMGPNEKVVSVITALNHMEAVRKYREQGGKEVSVSAIFSS